MKKIYILTGPSGAGASTAKFVFEELGYYILENFPSVLTADFIEKVLPNRPELEKICLMTRITEAKSLLESLKKHKEYEIITILLDCSDVELLRRFTLTRHVHPNAVLAGIDLQKAIEVDRGIAQDLIKDADIYIDTSQYDIKEFRTILYNKIESDNKHDITTVAFVSFGIKNGIQKDIDCLIDCRNLPNPYWVDTLREKNGLDKEIVDYLKSYPETDEFLTNTIAYLEYHLSKMQKGGRGYYSVGVCCSGGQHRSPYVANYLGKYFKKKYKTHIYHRDCPELNK